MRSIRRLVCASALSLLSLFAPAALAGINSGFDSDQMFAIKNYPNPSDPGGVNGWPMMGQVEIFNENTGAVVRGGSAGAGYTNVEGWVSLTFSGAGTNDAWCFAIRRWNTAGGGLPHHMPPYDGFNIRKFDSTGADHDQVTISSIGTRVLVGNIRYSSFNNHLFIGLDRNETVTDAALVYELDLNLDLVRIYTGPNTNTGGAVNVDVNPDNGKVYMINQRLGDDNGAAGTRGDLVAFDSGVTNSYTTLINGQTFSASHGDWALPNCVIYRMGATAADDTLVVFTDQAPYTTFEFWADTTAHAVDGNGNLQLKGTLPSVTRGWNGQQDLVNGNIHYGAMGDGFGTLRTNNTLTEFRNGEANWVDADSVPFFEDATAPIIANVPPDPDDAIAQFEYVRQLTLSAGTTPVTWSLLQAPSGAQIDSTGLIDGWTPGIADINSSFFFEVQASNTAGVDITSWNVTVKADEPINNGFHANHIYAIKLYTNPEVSDLMGKIEIYEEGTGTLVNNFYTNIEGWGSLTFSGTGTNDAWCYALRRRNTSGAPHYYQPPFNNLDIRKFRADGNVDASVLFDGLSGWLPATNVRDGNIRYSSFHDSLFIGMDRNNDAVDKAVVYEISLALNAILNVYQGPNTNPGGQVNVDINTRNGTLYMINQRLGDDNGAAGPLGDLVAFNTAGGSTNSYTTLVNGQSFATDGQPNHDRWGLPNCAIFREGATPADDTLVVFTDQAPYTTFEFWADTTAHPLIGGNLQLKGLLPSVARGWNGQQDSFNGNIHYGAMADGFGTLRTDNLLSEYRNNELNWIDADSAPYGGAVVFLPVIGNLPPNPDETLVQYEYIRQLTLTQGTLPVTWSLLQAPAGATIDQTGRISGWKPTAAWIGNTAIFQVQVSNAAGDVTATWNVNVQSLQDVVNNGFQVGQIFTILNYPNPERPGIWPPMGQIEVYDEGTGEWRRNLTNQEGWNSLTFSGTGTNDAWCYALRGWNTNGLPNFPHFQPPYNSLNIRRFDSTGDAPDSVVFHALAGWLPGTDVLEGNIRYSSFHDTLFVGVDRNQGQTDKAIVYEIDLALDSIINTYLGPNTNTGGQVNVDINLNDGTLYMINQQLGDDNGAGGPLGDLVAFDTSLGSTSNYVTLVNGQTFATDGQPDHDKWALPNCVIYRQGAAPSDDTLVVFMDQSPYASLEFWLDTTEHPLDANGNLQLRRVLPTVDRGWNGQQDTLTRDIHYGAMADGFGTLTTNNILIQYLDGDPNWIDADSPPYPFAPGLCNDPFADVDFDGDVDQVDFAAFQRCFSGRNVPIPAEPALCNCLDRTGDGSGAPDGDVDDYDLVVFDQCASGPEVPLNPSCAD